MRAAKHQEWSLRRCANNVLDQIQKDRRCSVNVIEHDDQGTRPTERFEETSRRPRDLFGDEGIISQLARPPWSATTSAPSSPSSRVKIARRLSALAACLTSSASDQKAPSP